MRIRRVYFGRVILFFLFLVGLVLNKKISQLIYYHHRFDRKYVELLKPADSIEK